MGVCLNRIILICGKIENSMASKVIAQINSLHEQSPSEDISLLIHSPGGQAAPVLAVYDAIKRCKCNINTICLDDCSENTTLLLSAGSKGRRLAFINASIAPPKQADISDKIFACFAQEVKLNTEKLIDLCRKGHIMAPFEARNAGIIDKVIMTQCPDVRKICKTQKVKYCEKAVALAYKELFNQA